MLPLLQVWVEKMIWAVATARALVPAEVRSAKRLQSL